jgi:hypothetical protein
MSNILYKKYGGDGVPCRRNHGMQNHSYTTLTTSPHITIYTLCLYICQINLINFYYYLVVVELAVVVVAEYYYHCVYL